MSGTSELNALQRGHWSEGPSGMLCNPHPTHGGIIDSVIGSSEWFVVFNADDLPVKDGFATRDEAVRAFLATFT